MASPGSLASNPPPRWGAPGDDLVGDPVGRRQARIPGSYPEVLGTIGDTHRVDHQPLSHLSPRRATTPAPTFHRRPRLRAVPDAVAHRHLGAPNPARDLPAVVRPDLVPTLSGDLVDYANLDHAASTPAFQRVARAVETATRTYSSVHRGTGWLSRVTSAHYEAARDEVARFVGAREDDVVVFTRSTTDSVNLLARALPRDTSVVVFASEHHATLLPWRGRDTVRLPVPGSTRDAEALLEAALRALPTGTARRPRQALVVLTAASNVTGEFWPVERLTAIARRHGARVLLDAAQFAAHRPIDLEALDVDWVAFSGHKVHAPYGTGVLAGRSDWLDAAQPYLAGGGATARSPSTAPAGPPAPPATRRAAPTCSAPSRSPRPAPPSASTASRSRPTRPGSPSASSTGCATSTASPPTRSSATTPSAARSSPSPSTASTAHSWRRPCRPSTASACGPASSARTCWSTPCSTRAPTSTTPRCGSARGWPAAPSTSSACWPPWPRWPPTGPGAPYEHTAEQGWAPVDDTRELSAPLPW